MVKRQTARSRFSRALTKIADWCRHNLHEPLVVQCQTLGQKLRGHCAYYGITGNMPALQRFRNGVLKIWRHWLGRRKRGARLSWPVLTKLLQRFPLPPATVIHSVYRHVATGLT